VVSFPQASPPKPFIHLSTSPYALYAPPIPFFYILYPEQYLVSTTDHQAPHYVIFSIPLLPRPSYAQTLPQHPILKHPQPTFLPQCQRPSFTPIQNNSSVYHNLYIFG
jgi:hypothetical protein